MKLKVILSLVGILLISSIFYYIFSNSSFSGPIGGWEESKAKIEAKYGYNKEVKLAALQLGEAYQEVIDNPDNISTLRQLDAGMACIYGVLISQGVDPLIANDSWVDIQDLVVSTYEQQRRYVHFNAKLSGGMLLGIEADTTKCLFEIKK